MVNFLLRTTDFLAFIVRLLSEDIIWLKAYCSSLSDFQCFTFLLYCALYPFIIKVILVIAGFILNGIKTFLKLRFLDNLSFKLSCSNPTFLNGYIDGYNFGYANAQWKAEHPVKAWWKYSSLNPSNWF